MDLIEFGDVAILLDDDTIDEFAKNMCGLAEASDDDVDTYATLLLASTLSSELDSAVVGAANGVALAVYCPEYSHLPVELGERYGSE